MTRRCEQCGAAFVPRREHARFCSANCRVAWNRENVSDTTAEVNALAWSISAMGEATGRLTRSRARDGGRAFAVVSEAVWWVTIVDGTLVRYHPDVYDQVLCRRPAAEQPLVEETLAGLRYVRNQIAHDIERCDFIRLTPDPAGTDQGRVADWAWTSMPAPSCEALSPQAKAWELNRYEAYQARLAGQTVGETFGRAAAFLAAAAERATVTEIAGHGA